MIWSVWTTAGPAPGIHEHLGMQSPSRVIVRTVFIVVFTLLACVMNGMDAAIPWHPWASFGFTATQNGIVTSVDRVSARSGLRTGDQVDMARLPPSKRIYVSALTVAPDGSQLALPIRTNGPDRLVRLSSHARTRTAADNITDIVEVVCLWAFILLAAALVLLRPTPVTWAFYIFSFVHCTTGTLDLEYLSPALKIANGFFVILAGTASCAALLSFALRFPDKQPAGPARTLERAILYVYAPLMAALWFAWYSLPLFANVLPDPRAWAATYVAESALYLLSAGILVWRYVTADARSRNRLRWITVAFAVAFLPSAAIAFIEFSPYFAILAPSWVINLTFAWELLAPIAVAYTVFKHRLFDIRFVMSRALIYTVTASVFVGVIALADFAIGKWLAESRFALVVELALALLVGISLTALHRRVENTLNGIIFRAQVKALEALRVFSHEIDLIPDPERLLAQTFEAMRLRLEGDYVGIYTLEGASYALTRGSAPSLPAIFPGDDFAVLHLRRRHEAFECEEPEHPLRGALLLPMAARTELVGFIVCGPKNDRTHYLPEEVETLGLLAHRAGTAYAWLTLRPATMQLAQTLP